MKKIVIVLAIILAAYTGFTIHKNAKRSEQQKKALTALAAPDTTGQETALQLAAKHKAVEDWMKALDKDKTIWDDRDLADFYSIQIENALKNQGSPVLIVGELTDIVRRDAKHIAIFSGRFPPSVQYLLEINPAQLAALLKRPRDYERYALIGTFYSAKAPQITIQSEPGQSPEMAEFVKIEPSPEYYVIKGKLIDFALLE